MAENKVKGYIAKSDPAIKEFQGETLDKEIKTPKELGSEHPFDFAAAERVFLRTGFVSGSINRLMHRIVGEFTVEVDNPNARKIIEDFNNTSKLKTELRPWIVDALVKGNGFMELDFNKGRVITLNANHVYVKRKRNGDVIGYNQWTGDIDKFNIKSFKFTPFKKNQIAHLKINYVAGYPYGFGVVWNNERVIENVILNEEDWHKLISRKAGAPMHIKVGVPGEAVNTKAIDDFDSAVKYMTNRTEWTTDANVDIKVIDFGNIGQNLSEILNHDIEMFSYGIETPLSVMGKSNIPEGLAKTQGEDLQRKIAAIQEDIETVIEQQIYRPLLLANGLKANVKFVWNLPGEEEINKRIEQIQKLLNTLGIDENMRRMLQKELARLLDFEDADKYLRQPEVGLDDKREQDVADDTEDTDEPKKQEDPERKQEEEKIPQPEVPGAKPAAESKKTKESKIEELGKMTVKEFVNIKEIEGFNYTDFLVNILRLTRQDRFTALLGANASDISDGMLKQSEINKLKVVLGKGFRENMTIRDIERELERVISFKDRKKDGKLIVPAANRPIVIARTETVRLANMGLVETFKDNNIRKVSFIAAMSDRTCEICSAMDGSVFEIDALQEGVNQPPLHTMCRCSLISVVE